MPEDRADNGNPLATQAPLDRLLDIMARLRSPGGCPWDAEQTPESLKPYIVEEAYEVLEAIDRGQPAAIRDELGDLLLQVVFLARIFEERQTFGMAEVINAIADKLIRRHPHVFAGTPVGDAKMLAVQWDTIKRRENHKSGAPSNPLAELPRHLPALQKARKLAEKTVLIENGGKPAPLLAKATEQFALLREGLDQGRRNQWEEHLGELLFTLAGLGATLNLDAEDILRGKNDQVIELHAGAARNPPQPDPVDLARSPEEKP